METRDNKGRFVKGTKVWNKGKHMTISPKTMFKKGVIPWNKGKEYLAIKGEKHFNWKGGISKKNHMIRTSVKWKMWREQVFRRDDFTCQNPNCKYCNNEMGVELHPHHIKPISLFPEMSFDLNNGITYCKEFHLRSGLHKNIKQRYMEED